MRYYSIKIYDPVTNETRLEYSTQFKDGSNNPRPLRVVFDIPFYNASKSAGMAYVKIYGVSYPEITQSSNFNNCLIEIRAGMAKGLPLADPNQQGIILLGKVFQAFGNWQGTEITLDLIVEPRDNSGTTPLNLTLNWNKGETLDVSVKKALKVAYPREGFSVEGKFDSRLISTTDQNVGTFYTVAQLGAALERLSKSVILDINYYGAQITQTNEGFYLYDNSVESSSKLLSYNDFIGNATYNDYQQINFKLVMRADLTVGDYITMPKQSNIANSRASFTQYRDNISFSNDFIINQIRHVGDSRQASADSWCSVIDAYVKTPKITQ